MNMQKILEHLYRSEINARLQWQWDGGFEVALLAGFSNDEVLWEESHNELNKAVIALANAALRLYPNSEFVLWWVRNDIRVIEETCAALLTGRLEEAESALAAVTVERDERSALLEQF